MSQKYQNDSKAEFTSCPSETESDFDSAEETKGKMKYQLPLLFIQVKTVSSLWQAAKSINYEISKEILVSNICHIEFIPM